MTHICDKNDEDGWGEAVAVCWTEDGKLYVFGGMCGTEYGGQVNFCPFCGVKAEIPVDPAADGVLQIIPPCYQNRAIA